MVGKKMFYVERGMGVNDWFAAFVRENAICLYRCPKDNSLNHGIGVYLRDSTMGSGGSCTNLMILHWRLLCPTFC